jgi:hypothetical protein
VCPGRGYQYEISPLSRSTGIVNGTTRNSQCARCRTWSQIHQLFYGSHYVDCRTAFETKCEMGGRSEEEKCVAKARILEMEPRSRGWKVVSFFGRGSC